MPTSHKVFSSTEKSITLSGILQIGTDADEAQIRDEICQIIHSKGGAFVDCRPRDLEFIRVSRKTAQVPATKAGFEWNGRAVKGLASQGSLYVRLTSLSMSLQTPRPRATLWKAQIAISNNL